MRAARSAPPLLLAAVALVGCSLFTDGGKDTSRGPHGPCQLIGFEFRDRTFNMQLGPEMRGRFVIRSEAGGDSLTGWSGESDGVQARRSPLDGPPSTSPLQWTAVVLAGRYTGTWKVHGDTVRWSFDDDQPVVAWMSEQPWVYDGRSLLAHWGDLDGVGWSLDAEMVC